MSNLSEVLHIKERSLEEEVSGTSLFGVESLVSSYNYAYIKIQFRRQELVQEVGSLFCTTNPSFNLQYPICSPKHCQELFLSQCQ